MNGTISKVLIVFIFFTFARSSADVGWYGDSPGHVTLEGEEHENIVLRNEVVKIGLNGGGPAFGHVNVKGFFEFYNNGPAKHVIMTYPLYEDAFPIQRLDGGWVNDLLTERGLSEENPVNHRVFSRIALDTADFRSGFDSRIKDYRDIKITVDGLEPLVEFVFRYDLDGAFLKTNRYVRWPVKFASGETKRVEIAFKNPYERRGGFGAGWYHYDFEYPLYTGGTWAGPIGNGTITVSYEEDTVGGPIFFQAPGCPSAEVNVKNGKTEIKWSFLSFEPPPNALIKIVKGAPDHFIRPTDSSVARAIGLEVDGEPAIILTPNIALKTGADDEAPNVAGYGELPQRTPIAVKSSRGEWWLVRLNDGTEGWLRWRAVDPDTGEELVYARFAYDGAE